MTSQEVKLHLLPSASRSTSVLITALFSKVPFTIHIENPASCKTEEYLKIHPFGKIPAAQTPEGPLYESNSISRYLARKSKSLYGSNLYEETQVDQWLDTIRMDFVPAGRFAYAVYGFPDSFFKYHLKAFQEDLHEYIKLLKIVDHKLAGKHYLVGHHLTIADITLVSDLSVYYKFIFTEKERLQLPNLTAYYYAHLKLAEFQAVLGKAHYPETPFEPIITVSLKQHAPKAEHKKEEKKVEAKPKKEEKKEEANDDEDCIVEEKAKVYQFPATTFDLFAFKTLYVNAPNKQEALNFLWANWDEKAFSFWYLKYDKLPSEGKKSFLTNNLMNGFLDRADHCRKYCLGVHGVYGDEPDFEIRGVWLWKGIDLLEPLKEHAQFDIYNYIKLDVNKAEDKELITQYWTKLEEDSDKVEGRTVRTVKFFK